MPDVHCGIGAAVGSVIPTLRAIIPAAVGVDIGCGMIACRTTLAAADLPGNLAPLRAALNGGLIRRRVVEAARTVLRRRFLGQAEAVNCRHNDVSREQHFGQDVYVTRKGAVGARAMSRGEARRRFTLADHRAATARGAILSTSGKV